MPELPEVERVRQSIEAVVAGATVERATLHRRDVLVIPGDPEGGFSRNRTRYRPKRASPAHLLQGLMLTGARRRGKQLALVSSQGPAVIVHLGMTGQVRRVAEGTRLPQTDHIHATWRLTAADGSRWRLVFRDPRRFGGWEVDLGEGCAWAFAAECCSGAATRGACRPTQRSTMSPSRSPRPM